MKLKADEEPPGELHQHVQPDSSSSTSTAVQPAEITYSNSDDDHDLEILAKDVFKNMKSMLDNPTPVKQQSEMLLLETVKTPSKKAQM